MQWSKRCIDCCVEKRIGKHKHGRSHTQGLQNGAALARCMRTFFEPCCPCHDHGVLQLLVQTQWALTIIRGMHCARDLPSPARGRCSSDKNNLGAGTARAPMWCPLLKLWNIPHGCADDLPGTLLHTHCLNTDGTTRDAQRKITISKQIALFPITIAAQMAPPGTPSTKSVFQYRLYYLQLLSQYKW